MGTGAAAFFRLPPLGGEGWGGGILSMGSQFINRPRDRIHDRVDVFIQLLVPKANEAKAARREPAGTTLVVLDSFWI